MAGISKKTASPVDGVIEKAPGTEEPTGILIGSATDLVWNTIPQPTEEETLETAKEACRKIVEAGITSIHWIALSAAELMAAKSLQQAGDVPLRIFLITTDEVFENLPAKADQSEPRIGGVLVFSDGYLASQTAALNKPYIGDPSNRGKLLYTQEELASLAFKIHRSKMQVIIHAMGDKAVDAALKAIQNLPKDENGFRHRIEQAALLNRQLVNRLRKLQPIVSVQPKVIESEFNVWSAVEHLGGTRAKMLFPVKTLLKQGVLVVGGSDCPMEPLNPLLGIQSLVMRKPLPGERLTVEEALSLFTIDAAYSTMEEKEKGSIEEGKLADLSILSEDPVTAPTDEIAETAVEMTIVGGKVVYQKMPASAVRDLN